MTAPFVHDLVIDAPAEVVFAHFCSATLMAEWFGFPTELDPVLGGRFRIVIDDDHIAVGHFAELDAPHRVVWAFGFEGDHLGTPPASTIVEVDISPGGPPTQVRLRHHGLPDAFFAEHASGWTQLLPRLAATCGDHHRQANA